MTQSKRTGHTVGSDENAYADASADSNSGSASSDNSILSSSHSMRFWAAVLISGTIWPFLWFKLVTSWFFTAAPNLKAIAVVGCVTLFVALLTLRLAKHYRPKSAWIPLAFATLPWCCLAAFAAFRRVDVTSPQVPLVFALAAFGLGVLGTGWLAYWPGGVMRSLARLVPIVLAMLPFWLCFQPQGMFGDAKYHVEYRIQQTNSPVAISTADAGRAVANMERAAKAGSSTATLQARLRQRSGELAAQNASPFHQFLGPGRNATLTNVALASDWNSSPPQILWRKSVGPGWSGVVVSNAGSLTNNLAITQEQRGDSECVVAYDVGIGTEKWVHRQTAFFESIGVTGPRATPMVVDDRVYAIGGTGWLKCLDVATGDAIWSVDTLQGKENLVHGVTGSPLVLGDAVIVAPTSPDGPCLAAYDREDGNLIWEAGDQQASYSSPTVFRVHGESHVVLFAKQKVIACDPRDGRGLWTCAWTNVQETNCAQPIFFDDSEGRANVFVSTAYGQGSAMFRLTQDGDAWRSEQRWSNGRMKTKFSTAVILGNQIIGLDNGILQSIDRETGKQNWKKGRYGHGQFLLVGELLLLQTESGDLKLIDPQPDGPRELGSMPVLNGRSWNNLCLHGSTLIMRNAEEMVALRITREE